MDPAKLKDAKLADSAPSECTLILTEGDSATIFVEYGLPFVEKDKFGVLTLKGMFPNVRDHPRLMEKNLVQSIMKILGLQYGEVYKDVKELRYGHLVIMTDQDHAGHHIKGLVINMFEYFWPSLLKVEGFLQMFITPIVTAFRDPELPSMFFYTISEFDEWQPLEGYITKYHKGLASFKDTEAEYFFRNFQKHVRNFVWIDDNDNKAIELAFSGTDIEMKRKWLLKEHKPGTSYYTEGKPIRYLDFINIYVRQALLDHVQRNIASIVDGFKRSQRKVFHCALEDPIIQGTLVLVAAFSGIVAENTLYRHGESSLEGVMIGMAQNFVGCNNINLLLPSGQFGTRVEGPTTHGGGRYVFTSLSPVGLYIFHKDDKLILNYLYDGGKRIEPSRFYPIIPMILVNGSEGVAPGWKSFIPQYNPREIIDNLICLLNDQEVKPMLAWYKGFNGEIREIPSGYETEGKIFISKKSCGRKRNHQFVDNDVIVITELPVRKWKKAYEKTLDDLKDRNDIESYTADHSNPNDVHYQITMTNDKLKAAKQRGSLLTEFKLTTTLSTTNMNLIAENGKIKKYDTPIEILKDFFDIRLKCYEMRKVARLRELMKAYLLLESKIRYVEEVREETVKIFAEKVVKINQLKEKKYNTLPSIEKLAEREGREPTQTEEEEKVTEMFPETGYDYLLSLPGESFADSTLEKLKEEMDSTKKDFDDLKGTPSKKLWLNDLDDLTKQLEDLDQSIEPFSK